MLLLVLEVAVCCLGHVKIMIDFIWLYVFVLFYFTHASVAQ